MIKKILLGLLAVIGLLIVGVVVFLLTFDLNHYRHLVEAKASQALGLPVEIQSMSTKLSLVPTIKVEGVRIMDTNRKEPILSIPQLEAVIELTTLLRGQIIVPKITVPKADLVWVGNTAAKTEKKENPTEEKKPQASANPVQTKSNSDKLWIDLVNIDALNCKIGKETPYQFNLNQISLKELSKFSFDFVYLNNTVNVSGNLGSILELPTKKENLSIDLTLKQDRAHLKINGKIGDVENLKKMSFQIKSSVPNLSALLGKWQIKNAKIPSLPLSLKATLEGDLQKMNLRSTVLTIGKSDLALTLQGVITKLKENPTAVLDTTLSLGNGALSQLWKIKPIEMTSKVTIDKKVVTAADIKLNATKSDAQGQLSVYFTEKPIRVQGNLNSTYLDIHDLIEFSKSKENQSNKSASPTKEKLLSTDKLPFDLLQKIGTNLQLNITNLRFSHEIQEYAGIDTSLIIKNNELKMPATIRIFGGKIQNQLNIQGQNQSVNLKTTAEGILLEKIKPLGKSIQNSSLGLSLSLTAKGTSLHDLASTASGNLVAQLTQGQIINEWFNTLPTTLNLLKEKTGTLAFSTQDQKTELICGAMNLSIKNGVVHSQDQIALETDTLNFIINGKINLKEENLNLTITPSISQTRGMANELLNTVQAIRLTGPWKNVTIDLDTKTALKNLAQAATHKLAGVEQNNQTVKTRLCQKVLGYPLKSSTKVTSAAPKKEAKQPSQKTTPQKDLTQQLMQSLSQALSQQKTPAKK